MPVKDLMTRPAIACRVGDTLDTPAQLMWEHDIGAVPVVDDEGRLVGMVTDRDICMATHTQGRAPREIPITTAMAKDVFACSPETALDAAEAIMRDKQIRRVPVVDERGRPVGMVSLNDLLREAARPTNMHRKQVSAPDVVQTMAAVSAPRQQASRAAS